MNLTKQQFCEALEAYKKQMKHDVVFANGLDKLLGTEVEFIYDNSAINNAFLFLLQTIFKSVDARGNCLIERHLFYGNDFDTDADLYDELVKRTGNDNN